MKAYLKVDVDEAIERFKEFQVELMELCNKYKIEPQLAKDDETNDNFIVINVKDFIKKEDIELNIGK